MDIKLTKQTQGQIDELHSAMEATRSKGVRMHPDALSAGIGAQGAQNFKRLSRDVMTGVLGADTRGKPKGLLEAAAAKAVRADADDVRNRVASLAAKGNPGPADYYEILNKVLVDSGSVMHTDPKVVRAGLAAAQAKATCSVCSACSACSACAGCAASVVEGLVVAGVAGVAANSFV